MAGSKVNQLQLLQQNLQNISLQKQQIEIQFNELASALGELETSSKAYKIVGKIMISSDKDKLQKELSEKKDFLEVRLQSYAKQEERLKKDFEKAQKEALEEIQDKK